MNYRRDQRLSRAALFDDIEDGGLRTSAQVIDERGNDKAIDTLHDRVSFLKRVGGFCSLDLVLDPLATCVRAFELTGDIHEEAESHNRMLSRMGNDMDASRGIMSGTMARFKSVFEKRSNRRMCKLVAHFMISFLAICYFFRFLFQFLYG